jgi:hypothetical protein
MSPMKRYAKRQAKATKRRRLKAQERIRQQVPMQDAYAITGAFMASIHRSRLSSEDILPIRPTE